MPLPMLKDFMEKQGAKTTNKDALQALADYLDMQLELIAKKAIGVANNDERVIVALDDLKKAITDLWTNGIISKETDKFLVNLKTMNG